MSTPTIHSAAQSNQLRVVRDLLDQDPQLLNSIDADGRAALHWAASTGSVDIIRYLIDKKAEVDEPDASGWTPLHIAVSAGHEDAVTELIGGGADVNRKNDKGITPLHYAASKSRIDIGRLLILKGADINALDKANQRPLHRAATTGSVGFVSMLLEPSSVKLRLNTADRVGNTPLHLAMESAHAEVAVLLVNAGADRTRDNLENETPESLTGVGGREQQMARQHVIDYCGPCGP